MQKSVGFSGLVTLESQTKSVESFHTCTSNHKVTKSKAQTKRISQNPEICFVLRVSIGWLTNEVNNSKAVLKSGFNSVYLGHSY